MSGFPVPKEGPAVGFFSDAIDATLKPVRVEAICEICRATTEFSCDQHEWACNGCGTEYVAYEGVKLSAKQQECLNRHRQEWT